MMKRLETEDHRNLNWLINQAMFDDCLDYSPPFVSERDGLVEVMGSVFRVSVGKLVRQNHISDAIQKLMIQADGWSWDGNVRITINVHTYTGSRKYYRFFELEHIGLLSGDQDKFARDIILLRMTRD